MIELPVPLDLDGPGVRPFYHALLGRREPRMDEKVIMVATALYLHARATDIPEVAALLSSNAKCALLGLLCPAQVDALVARAEAIDCAGTRRRVSAWGKDVLKKIIEQRKETDGKTNNPGSSTDDNNKHLDRNG